LRAIQSAGRKSFSHSNICENNKVSRDLSNMANRQINCMTANIDKTVNASLKQLAAIEIIQNTIGLENLPEGLLEAALIRISNPESSLNDLCSLLEKPISKGALAQRFNKIIQISEELGENNHNAIAIYTRDMKVAYEMIAELKADNILINTDVSFAKELTKIDNYLDLGIHDTMEDLKVNFIGAFVFSIYGYLYTINNKKYKLVGKFITKKV
jgi:hypothetical protein